MLPAKSTARKSSVYGPSTLAWNVWLQLGSAASLTADQVAPLSSLTSTKTSTPGAASLAVPLICTLLKKLTLFAVVTAVVGAVES